MKTDKKGNTIMNHT